MAYQCNDNYDLFVEYIEKMFSLIEESCSTNVIVLGDFNAAVNSTFENELIVMCDAYQLIISDYRKYGRNSGQHTYVSDAHNSTSWLDHVICSQDVHLKLHSIDILDQLPSFNHLPLSFIFDSTSSR